MAIETIIRWGDGFLAITPAFPERLLNELRYWHRSLEYNEALRRMVSTGEYRELYTVRTYMDDSNQLRRELLTMPGFMHLAKTVLSEEGYEYTILDERTPLPQPDLLAAFAGLRDYQLECSYTAISSGGGIVACPTGWGKTHIISSIIKAYSHSELCARNTPLAVVATPEKDITEKDYEDLDEQLEDREVGLVMSGRKRFSDDVQVITLDSLHRLDPADIGLLIIDEVHTAASEKRSNAITSARKALKWGVSATPSGRFDGRDIVTEGLFGPVVYQRSYAQGIEDGALVPIQVYWINAPEPGIGLEKYLRYKSRAGQYRHGVDRNDTQNAIIGRLMTEIPMSYQTMCIMPHIDQMNALVPLCPGVPVVHAETSQEALAKNRYHNVAPVSKKERRDVYQRMKSAELRRVLCTHVYKQGVNFPELEVVINAGGGGSELVAKQIPGRESRNTEGKTESFLIDFWHPWDTSRDKKGHLRAGPILRDDRSREKCYTQLGFNQVWLDRIEDLPFLRTEQND